MAYQVDSLARNTGAKPVMIRIRMVDGQTQKRLSKVRKLEVFDGKTIIAHIRARDIDSESWS